MRSAISAIILCFALSSAAWAQEPGLLFIEEEAKRLAEELRDLRTLRAVVENQRAVIDQQKRQMAEQQNVINSLKDQASSQAIAIAIAEDRDKRRQEVADNYKEFLSETRQLNVEMREALKVALEHNRALQKELFWTRILGPLAIVGSFAAGGFFIP